MEVGRVKQPADDRIEEKPPDTKRVVEGVREGAAERGEQWRDGGESCRLRSTALRREIGHNNPMSSTVRRDGGCRRLASSALMNDEGSQQAGR